MNRYYIALLALGAFVVGAAELIVGGILKPISEDLGISIALAGQLITVFSLAFAIGTPIVIALTSRIARKTMLVGSLVLFSAGSAIPLLSEQILTLYLSRVLVGLSAGVFTVVAFGAAAKLVPAERVGKAIGTIALGISCAMVVGIPLGIAVADWFGWRMIFAGLAVLSLAVLLLIARGFPRVEGDAAIPLLRQLAIVRNPILLTGFCFSFFFSTSSSVMNSYVTPYLHSVLSMETAQVGYMMFVLGAFSVVGSRMGGQWTDRWGTSRTIYAGIAALVLTLAMLPPLAAWPAANLALLSIWMFAMAATIPAIQTYFVQQAPEVANLAISLNASLLHLGVAVGAGIGGFAVNAAETPLYNPWAASAAAVISLTLAVRSVKLAKRSKSVATAAPSR